MKKAVVLGGEGQIGRHLIRYLKSQGYWVRSVDIQDKWSTKDADEFLQLDLTVPENCNLAVAGMEEVYQLAAQMGGMGFISQEHLMSFHDSSLINTYVPWACVDSNIERLFFSSSVCVYPTQLLSGEATHVLSEEDVIPANPNEAYGWEKLMAEMRYREYDRLDEFEVRIARFENTYGEECEWDGGREKVPAALCRKVAEAKNGGAIEVWGDGKATRHFTYVGDLVKGIYDLMQSDVKEPLNLGSDEIINIEDLAKMIIDISGKNLSIKYVDGPQGVRNRHIDHSKAAKLINWNAPTTLQEGLPKLYSWITSQV